MIDFRFKEHVRQLPKRPCHKRTTFFSSYHATIIMSIVHERHFEVHPSVLIPSSSFLILHKKIYSCNLTVNI
nr:hypothetical protein Iba_chr15aCG14240 [Ipomoea batatas]GMD97082.1 hypothetical protein Iba_chr15bCG10970 [Ipomoea batatas]